MSYRGVKRLLGETSLERKCRFLFGACLLGLITGSFYWYSGETEKLVRRASRNTGRGLVDGALFKRHMQEQEKVSESQFTAPDHTKQWAESLESQEYTFSFIYPKSTGEGAPQDEFEWRVLERFSHVPEKSLPMNTQEVEFDWRIDAEKDEYQYYQAVRAKKACIDCHVALGTLGGVLLTDLNEGDLMAVVKIAIKDKDTQADLNKNRAILLATAIITTFLAMVASYVIVRYVIVKPLKHLRDVSDEISHGNMSLRADIHTGDEFEELATAFNRMLRHLITVQDEIRQANRTLDVKVDELAQANMQLYEANRLKSDFLATMSHELRTPLNSIIGFSDVLGGISSLDDKQKRYVKNIQNSGKTLLEMINDILDLAKIESGKTELRLTDFDIETVVAAQCDMARPLSERKNIDLEAHIEADLPALFQDQAKVQQVLNNLLSNAIKFTPEGGRIAVTVKRDEKERLVMTVSDTGVGIAEEDQQTIFEKFRQGQSTLTGGDAMTREQGGTGLGLSIVKELCKLLGGEVSLESELGRGSTFTVIIPWVHSGPMRQETPSVDGFAGHALEEFARTGREPATIGTGLRE
jgi:two-component system sensor histidine kinase BarA